MATIAWPDMTRGSNHASELMIGLTILAVGTSLPEIATCLLASLRGERDIAVGSIVGSNILNILAVIGIGGMLAPEGIGVPPVAIWFDMPVMIGVALLCLPIFFTDNLIARWEGALFFGYYLAYTAYLILHETQPEIARAFGLFMLLIVIPVTVVRRRSPV